MRVCNGCGLLVRIRRREMLVFFLMLVEGYLTSVRGGPVEEDASALVPTPSTTTIPPPDVSEENPLHLEGEHVCNHTETKMVRNTQVIMTPVTVQVLTWCISVPPRCVKNTTEMRRKTIEQTVARTVTVRECCPGYRPEPPPESSVAAASGGPRQCVPDCPLGCEQGTCSEPHRCDCTAGFSGLRCDAQCPEGTWGEGCAGNCSCARGGACDSSTGSCVCAGGWRGARCDYPCARGFFGEGCAQRCACPTPSCHAVTGACTALTPALLRPAGPDEETSSAAAPVQPPAHRPPQPPSASSEDAGAPGNALDAAHEDDSVEQQQPSCEGSACNSGVMDGGWEPVQRLTQEPPDAMVTDAPASQDEDTDLLDPATATTLPEDSDEDVDADGDHTTSYPDPGPHTDPPLPVPEVVATETPSPVATTTAEGVVGLPVSPRGDKETEMQRKKAADAKKQRAKERSREKVPSRKEPEDGEESSETDSGASPQLPIELTPAFWPRIPDHDPPPPSAPNPAAWPYPAAANNIAPDLKPQDLASLKAPSAALPPAPPPPPADAPGGFSLSRLEVAAGAAVLGAALVGVVALAAARCGGRGGGGCCGGQLGPKARRSDSGMAAGDGVELRALTGRTLAQTDAVAGTDDAAALAAVRPLFFSPLYLPATTASTPGSELSSPVDAPVGTPIGSPGTANVSAAPGAAAAGTGLVLTALFSAPAPAHLQTLCALQPASEMALLRESLSAHYDVPPTLLRRPTLTGADRRASVPTAAAVATTASNSCAGPLATPGAISWAPDPPPTASLYLSPPPPTPTPAALRTSTLLSESFSAPMPPVPDHVYEELPCWPRLR